MVTLLGAGHKWAGPASLFGDSFRWAYWLALFGWRVVEIARFSLSLALSRWERGSGSTSLSVRQVFDWLVAVAGCLVVVDHSAGLHEGVDDGGSYEAHAAFFEVLAEGG